MYVTILKLKEAQDLERDKIDAVVNEIEAIERGDIVSWDCAQDLTDVCKNLYKCLNIFYNNLNSIEATIRVIKDNEQLLLDDME